MCNFFAAISTTVIGTGPGQPRLVGPPELGIGEKIPGSTGCINLVAPGILL